MRALRSALFNFAFLGFTVLFTLACVPVWFFPRTIIVCIRFWSRAVAWMLERIVGITLTVRGRENIPDGPFVVSSKHQSTFDTVMFFWLLSHPAYVVKRELSRIPLYNQLGEGAGWITVDREGGARALTGLVRDTRAAVAAGRQPVIFPEGTRTAPGERRPYQRGIAAIYLLLKVPVLPVALNSGLYWGRRTFMKRPGSVIVEFLPPIMPGLDAQEFMAELEDRVEAATARLVADPSVDKSVDKSTTHGTDSIHSL
jgi:1-acyl-sn-glycerol-3-phosphate acyltransferase